MKLVALCGAAGAGKDTVAEMLPARKLAFADVLYREVAGAFGVTVEWLKDRGRKDARQPNLMPMKAADAGFRKWAYDNLSTTMCMSSPRQILQWWGDYRRAQDPDYFVNATDSAIERAFFIDGANGILITDVRFPNEAAMVRQLGGRIWQIKRPGYEAGGTGHASDTAGDEFAPDRVVVNRGSLESLRATVLAAWEGV